MKTPACLGGPAAFADGLPFSRPFQPPYEAFVARLRPSYEEGRLTNGRLVREFEESVAERLGVEHAVAVASCTAGLMLAVRILARQGDVVLPSFTFSASALAVVWNGRRPRFAECRSDTFQVDLDDLTSRVEGAGMVMATHVSGAPCEAERVVSIARSAGIPAIFDAAHALGAWRGDVPVGSFGDAEVFSLSPTKLVVAGEGGVVATTDAAMAEQLRIGRDYGNPGDYDSRFPGLNARMSELHAALAIESLDRLDEHLDRRRAIARSYCTALEGVDGVRVQAVDPRDRSTWKDFTIAIDAVELGVTRDELRLALGAEGVDTRCYFDPPAHRQQAFADFVGNMPATDALSRSVLSLPIYPDMSASVIDQVADLVRSIAHHGEAISAALHAGLSPG